LILVSVAFTAQAYFAHQSAVAVEHLAAVGFHKVRLFGAIVLPLTEMFTFDDLLMDAYRHGPTATCAATTTCFITDTHQQTFQV
jgi:hypothetical protein